MLPKSTTSSPRKKTRKRPRAPIDPKVRREARRIAKQYAIIVQPDEQLGHVGSAVEMPHVFADGQTAGECLSATLDALTLAVAAMLERDATPPEPASGAKRQARINVRVTAREKFILQQAARRGGFKGIGDYVRATALSRSQYDN